MNALSMFKSAMLLLLLVSALLASAIVVQGEELVEPVKTFTVPWLPDPSVNNITVTLIPASINVSDTIYVNISGNFEPVFRPVDLIAVDRGSNTIAVAWARRDNDNTSIYYIYLTLFRFYDVDGDGRLDTYSTITRYIGCAYRESMLYLGVVAGNGTVLVYWSDGYGYGDGLDLAVVDENGTVLLYEDPTLGVGALSLFLSPPGSIYEFARYYINPIQLVHYVPWANSGRGGFLVTSFNLTGVRYYLIYYNASEGRWRIDYWSDVWEVPDPSSQSILGVVPIVGEEKILLAITYGGDSVWYTDVVFTDDRGVIGRPNITIGNGILIYYGRHVNIGNNSYFVLVGANITTYDPYWIFSSKECIVFVIDEHTGEVMSLTLDPDVGYTRNVAGGKDGFILLTEYGRLIKLSIDGGQLYKVNETTMEEGYEFSLYDYDYASEDTSGVLMLPLARRVYTEGVGYNYFLGGVAFVRDVGDGFEITYMLMLSAEDLPEPLRDSELYREILPFFIGALDVDTFVMYVDTVYWVKTDTMEEVSRTIGYILVALGDTVDAVPVAETVVGGEVVLPVSAPPKFIAVGDVPYVSVTSIYEYFNCSGVCWFFDPGNSTVFIKVGDVPAHVHIKFSDIVNRSSELLIPSGTMLRNIGFMVSVIVNEVWDLFDDGVWFWGLRVPGYTTTPLDFGVDVDGGNVTITSVTDNSINMVVYPEQNNTTLKLYGVVPENVVVNGEEISEVSDLSQLDAYDKAWYYDEETSTVYVYYSDTTPGEPIAVNVYLQPPPMETSPQQTQPIILVPFTEEEGREATGVEVITINPSEIKVELNTLLVVLAGLALTLLALPYLRRK